MSPSHKEIFESSFILGRAQKYALEAILAAHKCDADRARRLRKRALRMAQKAEDKLATATQAARKFYYTDNVIVRQLASLRADMARIAKLLKRCAPQTKYPFKKAGSFGGTTVAPRPSLAGQRIDFEFKLDRDIKCEKLCLISVYYIEEDATGKRLKNPSKGYKAGFDPLMGGTLSDVDAAGGFIVDTPQRKLNAQMMLVPQNSPCMPTSKRTGNVVTGTDSPSFVKRGFTAYFETCLVCLDNRPKFEIFGCMKWRHRGGRVKVLPRGGSNDRKGASDGFVSALELYLANHP